MAPPSNPTEKAVSGLQQVCIRIAAGCLVWLAVSGLSVLLAWTGERDTDAFHGPQSLTQVRLTGIALTIEKYHKKHGAPPRTMDELRSMTSDLGPLENGPLLDGWGRPYQFAYDGSNCMLISHGRDGKVGGNGLDCDLTTDDPFPKAAKPTLHQYLYEMPSGGIIKICIVCGGLAAVVSALIMHVPTLEPRRLITQAGVLIAIVWISVFAVQFVGILYLVRARGG